MGNAGRESEEAPFEMEEMTNTKAMKMSQCAGGIVDRLTRKDR